MSIAEVTDAAADFEAACRDVVLLGREESRVDAVGAVARLVSEAADLGAEGTHRLLSVAQALQDKRAFALLLVLCILAGRAGLATPRLRQKEVQALIELGQLDEAIDAAKALAEATAYADPEEPDERGDYDLWAASKGNIGRAHKQAYLNAAKCGSDPDPTRLRLAAETYLDVWERNPTADATYHAVNAAALILRAVRDHARSDAAGTPQPDEDWAFAEDARRLAEEILRIYETDLNEALQPAASPADLWTLATCAEAYLVLDLLEDAALCYGAFAGNPANDAFKIGAALRQLEEVWGFSGVADDGGGRIVRLLKAALLNLDKGRQAACRALPAEADMPTESVVLNPVEAGLMEKDLAESRSETTAPTDGYQAYFRKRRETGTAGQMLDVERLMGALARAHSICAIEAHLAGRWERIGTGFLVDGAVFHSAWAGQPLIVSNHHVTAQVDGALSASFRRCRALFLEYDPIAQTEREHAVDFQSVLWRSGERAHDTTVLRPAGPLPACARVLGPDAVSTYLPRRPGLDRDGTDYHVVILGFPGGGEMRFSFGDELLLDHSAGDPGKPALSPEALDGQPVRLHYRTPSLPGSSGSPVFESGTWKLVGIHHRGRKDCPRLPTRTGTYEANEGIWLASIRAAIQRSGGAGTGSGEDMDTGGAASEQLTSERVVLARPLGKPAAATPAVPPVIPGRRTVHPADSDAVISRHLRRGLFDGDLDEFRLRSAGFETVIGDDNRTQIHDTAAYPFRMICSLTMHWPGGMQTAGTGFLVGQRTVITAGHCVLPCEGSPYPEGIEVRPGRSGHHEPFAHLFDGVHASEVSLHPNWTSGFDPRFDVGALHLSHELGEELGWFRVGARPRDALRRHWVHVTGYPGDKMTPSSAEGGAPGTGLHAAELWHHATPVEDVHDGRIYYPADTFAGQSGSPVYTLDPDGQATAVGVHAYGIGSGQGDYAYENNSAAWIDSGLLQVISDWRSV